MRIPTALVIFILSLAGCTAPQARPPRRAAAREPSELATQKKKCRSGITEVCGILGVRCTTLVLLPAALGLPAAMRKGSGNSTADRTRSSWLLDAIATVGAAGYSPVAPAAVAAFVALPAAWVLGHFTTTFRFALVATVTAISFLATWRFANRAPSRDWRRGLVVDVFCGFLVTLVWIPFQPSFVLAAGASFLVLHHVARRALWTATRPLRPLYGALVLLGSAIAIGLLIGSLTVGVGTLIGALK